MKYIQNKIADLLFPRRCAICDKALIKDESGICPDCLKRIKYIEEPVCFKCGRPVLNNKEYCDECEVTRHEFIGGRFVFPYDYIGTSVYKFKYMNRPEYIAFYAKAIEERLGEFIRHIDPDGFVPVPIHKKRYIKRGYNQAEELSKELSKLTGIQTYNDLVLRIKDTVPQKKINKIERQINMKKAFIVKENSVKLRKIIVVDDIFTTGSTIDSLARELKKSGVEKIYFITITAAGT